MIKSRLKDCHSVYTKSFQKTPNHSFLYAQDTKEGPRFNSKSFFLSMEPEMRFELTTY